MSFYHGFGYNTEIFRKRIKNSYCLSLFVDPQNLEYLIWEHLEWKKYKWFGSII
jgi:hypothetical protein